ncbi:uncharacterized protein TNCV_408721 [Trichonephila clavipes]|nr:uncharacterized protein TNCV_408721 [Trichonephila clavipes]
MRNARRFNVWPEVYFSGLENVTEFLEDIDNQIKLLEIPSDLSCAYLKGHLLSRALDWYQIFGSTLVQNTTADFAQLKAALSKAFPAIQYRKDLETRFYASQQRQNQEPTDFVYDLLKLKKKLELGMSEKELVDHIFVRLEPQVQDYVEVRNPQTAIQLLEVLAKFEERYSCKATLGSRNSNNVEGRGWNERRMSNVGGSKIILDFDRKSLAIQESQVEDIKRDDGNLRVDLSETKLNVVANVLDNNTIESIIGEKVNCAIIRDLVLSSRDRLIEEQKTDPELGHIYRYLENPEDSSVNAAISPIKLISDNGPQFISDIFENLSERLGIRHVKTVVYRPQANRTECVNRDLVQMIANYVNEQHDTWDQFLCEFAYAIRTAVNETTVKTPAELFLGRKLITPFQKLVMVSDGTEFAVGDIEGLFEEARRNPKTKHEKWEKYYNRRRRDVQIKVNDWVLVATHPLSSATRKVVSKFKPKFEGPYRVLDVKNNNVVIWKAGKRLTINADQVRIYRHRKCDETEIGTGSSDNGSLRDESRVVLTEYNGDQMSREMVVQSLIVSIFCRECHPPTEHLHQCFDVTLRFSCCSFHLGTACE